MKQIVLFCLLSLTGIATSQPEMKTQFFDRGSFVLDSNIEYFDSMDSDRVIKFYTVSTGAGYYFLRNVAIYGISYLTYSDGFRVDDEEDPQAVRMNAQTLGLDLAFLFRWHFIRLRQLSLYIDLGTGMIFSTGEFPPSGTVWNFASRWGAGFTIRINDKFHAISGIRRLHISNGKGFGHPRNPAYDARGGYIGLVYSF